MGDKWLKIALWLRQYCLQIIELQRLTLNVKCPVPDNHIVVINVDNIDTLRHIKSQLQEKADIPVSQQILKVPSNASTPGTQRRTIFSNSPYSDDAFRCSYATGR